MSDYKQEMSFEERCRQPMDAPLRAYWRRKSQPPSPEALAKFKEWCQKFKKKKLDNQRSDDILPMLKEDR
jgi:hypothetical protein